MMTFYNNEDRRGPNFFELKIYTENAELKKTLQIKAAEVNAVFHSKKCPDAGFDLFTPNEQLIMGLTTDKIDLEVNCAMFQHSYRNYNGEPQPVSYYLYPRSSTGTKTALRLANSVGIIDSGYRGNIMAVFDNIRAEHELIPQWSRLVQICSPTLEPFMVSIVDDKSELGETTRGSNGFGSTGQ